MNLMLGCFAALLLLALHYGFRYGNPLPERESIQDRLSPQAQKITVVVVFCIVFLATAAVLWLSMRSGNFILNTPALLLDHIQTGVIRLTDQVK